MGEPQIGASCDDGNVASTGDVIQADCGCAGLFSCPTGTTVTVTTANDSGGGSLREAINCANADPGLDTIIFNIPGAGPHLISLENLLPTITDDGIVIDGTTQPGNFPMAGLIRIYPGNYDWSGLTIAGDNCAVYGLDISGADNGILAEEVNGLTVGSLQKGNLFHDLDRSGVSLDTSYVVDIRENIFGTDLSGSEIEGHATGQFVAEDYAFDNISIFGGASINISNNLISNSERGSGIWAEATDDLDIINNRIGTSLDGTMDFGNGRMGIELIDCSSVLIQTNLISGNAEAGISLTNVPSFNIISNYIGTDSAGDGALPNGGHGAIDLASCTSGTIYNNLISGNETDGIEVGDNSTSITIQDNYIGLALDGVSPLGNTGNGIILAGSSIILIRDNFVAHNQGGGIYFWDDPISVGVTILGNSIYCNNSQLNGIFLNAPANNNQGIWAPIIYDAQSSVISGEAVPNSTVEVYRTTDCLSAGPDGQTYLGTTIAGGDGLWTLNAPFTVVLSTGDRVTVTATDLTLGNTSEFSAYADVDTTCPFVFGQISSDAGCGGWWDLTQYESFIIGGQQDVIGVNWYEDEA
ncbi:MAG: right-handed parallel beta-helix repeat-containing protein, partial [Lewinella sp.]|nr:right-handed parallel beta-helix repeat-containing protein [Lewinella sp.]